MNESAPTKKRFANEALELDTDPNPIDIASNSSKVSRKSK